MENSAPRHDIIMIRASAGGIEALMIRQHLTLLKRVLLGDEERAGEPG